VHFPGLKKSLLRERSRCSSRCAKCRAEEEALDSELLDWLKLLLAEDIPPDALRAKDRRPLSRAARGAVEKRAGRASLRASYLHVAPALVVPARMLSGFFVKLRTTRSRSRFKEWLTLLEAMQRDVISPSIDEFYYLSRTTLVKRRAERRQVDRAFRPSTSRA